jgi:hypothetical protein
MLKAALVGVILAIGAGAFVVLNPILFGFETGVPHDKFLVFDKHFMMDGELQSVHSQIPDDDFQRYRNHCLRVLTFARYLMPSYVYDAYPSVMNIVAMAVAYHDVGVWTNEDLDYLESSVKQMEFHTRKEGLFEEEHIDIARQIIMEHHKITLYNNETHAKSNAVDAMVNAVRMVDWADSSMGMIRYDVPAPLLEAAYAKLDAKGYHHMLFNLGDRLSPHSFLDRLRMLKVFKY